MDATFLSIVIVIMLLLVFAFMVFMMLSAYRREGANTRTYLMTITEDGKVRVRRYRGSKNITIDRVEKW